MHQLIVLAIASFHAACICSQARAVITQIVWELYIAAAVYA